MLNKQITMSYNHLYTYASASLIFTLILAVITGLLIINKAVIIKSKSFEQCISWHPISCLIVFSLLITRQTSRISDKVFQYYLEYDFCMLLLFLLLRFYCFLKNPPFIIPLYVFNFILLISFVSIVLRGLLKLGFFVENLLDESPRMVLLIGNVTENVLQTSLRFVRKTFMESPKLPKPNRDSRMLGISKNQLYVGVAGLVIGGGVLYYTRASAIATIEATEAAKRAAKAAEDSAKAAEVSATATQQRTDIKAVKHGLLSVDDYNEKYKKK